MQKKKVSQKAVVSELRSLAMISGGMILGSMSTKAVNKVLKVDETIPGMQIKKFVAPVAMLSAGAVGSIKMKNVDVKMLCAGVGASGAMSTAKVFLGKDLLSGLGKPAIGIYHAPAGYAQSFQASLPELSPASSPQAEVIPAWSAPEQVEETDFEIL